MLKRNSVKTSTLLIVVGLLVLPIFLAACDTVAVSAESLAKTETVDAGKIAGPPINDVVETPVDATRESLFGFMTTGRFSNNNQARIVDRSEHIFDPETAAEPGAVEIEGLTYMREEEKLARDVYLALYDQWGMPVFQNIAGSEQVHMDSILMLLDQYGLTDPAAGKDAGEFTNPLFQSLYEQLVGKGSLSLADALIVGATIEELDIVDLEERLAQTDNEYIVRVYTNLLAGSENHLRAFVSNLERQTGESYQPVYLDQDAYQAIMNGAAGRGGGNGGGNGWGVNGGNGNGRRNGQGQGGNA